MSLLGPNIHWPILWVRYDRKIAGWARGFDMFDSGVNLTRQLLLSIGTTFELRASSDNTDARSGLARLEEPQALFAGCGCKVW